MNTVGTFSTSSASYNWNRVAAAVDSHASSSATWHVLVADDFHMRSGLQACSHVFLHLMRGGRSAIILE